MLELLASGTIFANKYPADWPVHAWYPNIVELAPGQLLCMCRLGAALYSDDGRIVQFRSTDGGETWLRELIVWNGSRDEKPYWYAPAGITLLKDGTLVLTGFRIHRPGSDVPTCNDATGACLPEETVLFCSGDNGRTWSEPAVVTKPPGVFLEAYGGIVPLDDGRWLQAFDVTKGYDDPEPSKPHIIGLISDDRATTWANQVLIAGGSDAPRTYWHMRLTKVRDGRIVGFAWTGDVSGQSFLALHRIEGSADGRSWREPEPTGIPGQTNCPADLGDGNMAIAYTRREGESPGIYVALSTDEGRTWALDGQVRIWDAYGRESLGVPRTATYPSSHDNIAFGAPNLIRLSTGQLLASFWATVMGQTVCKWARLELTS